MGTRTVFTKQLAAAVSNGICASQSLTGGTPALLNGSLSNYLSTTTTAKAAAGTFILTLASVTGIVVGQSVSDTTTAVIPTGTVVAGVSSALSTVTLSQPIGGAGVANGDTIVFPGTATIDTATAANTAIGRRVVVAYTGTDTSFVVTGTNAYGNPITDTIVGASGAGQSNLDFVTVSSIVSVGSVTGFTAGTNGVGSSAWWTTNYRNYAPMNIGIAVELVTGAVNYTVQHTYDDPNGSSIYNAAEPVFPLPFSDPILVNETATADGSILTPVHAMRILINSGTGEIRVRFEQAGAG